MSAGLGIPGHGSAEIEVEGRRVQLTSLDKVLWPEARFTKAQMLSYYAGAAPHLLPELEGRALTLGRWPNGVEGAGFAQTECRGRPEWMRVAAVRLQDGRVRRHCVVDDLASLLWVANQNAIELHSFLHRAGSLDHPDHGLFDLDPGPGATLVDCAQVALSLRTALADRGLSAAVAASGSVGLHLRFRWPARTSYPEAREMVRALAVALVEREPDRVTDSPRADRRERVLIDWRQNDPARTIVCLHSLRATDVPRAATPLDWELIARAVASGDAAELADAPAAAVRASGPP